MFKRIFKFTGITVFIIIGLFAIWFRFFVSEYEEVKNTTVFEHRQSISTDGPYVLYEKDSVRIINVQENLNDYRILDDRFAKDKPIKNIKINSYGYDNPSEIAFKLDLMDSLVIPQAIYLKQNKIFAVSDIEGNMYAFHKLLRANEIIDSNSNWTFGSGHLVLVGDFVDRGLNVTQCLWLIYKLEKQASNHGGRVHFILGNHELFNLRGINYHVRSKYKNLATKLDLDYSKDFYGINSELGRWLRTKNTIEKIGDILFVHGGISQDLLNLDLTIKEINQIVRNNISTLNYTDSMSEIIYGGEGPLKYRGFGHAQDTETSNIISKAKQYFNVSTLIIGHSTVHDIYRQYERSLINIDVHFPNKDSDINRGKGLLIEADNWYNVDDIGNKGKIQERATTILKNNPTGR
jgi:hypothetical protein